MNKSEVGTSMATSEPTPSDGDDTTEESGLPDNVRQTLLTVHSLSDAEKSKINEIV